MEEYSLRSQVFQTIRDDILKGKYEENDELREATLGKELGVSRTPVKMCIRDSCMQRWKRSSRNCRMTMWFKILRR